LRDVTFADDPDALPIVRSYQFSDRDQARMRHLVTELEALPVGRDREFYRRALEQRGYRIIETDTIGNRVQFEAVKDGQGVALNVALDQESDESTQVKAAPLWWEVSRSRLARSEERPRLSEREHGPSQRHMVKELEELPVDRDRQFYRQALRQRGYQNIETTLDTEDTLHLEAEKDDQPVTLAVSFDEQTGKSTEVAAAASGQTERTAKGEEAPTSRGQGRRFSDPDQPRAVRLIRELKALPVGRDKQFYHQALRRRGYEVPATHLDTDNQLQLEAVKDGQRLS
jgi:hypothetical protein